VNFAESEERNGREAAKKGARASGTPLISFFTPAEMLAVVREAGLSAAQCVSAVTLTGRYFAGSGGTVLGQEARRSCL